MLPHGLSLSQRRLQSSLRKFSLTPAGVSTNEVFDIIFPDIIEVMTSGFACIDANDVP